MQVIKKLKPYRYGHSNKIKTTFPFVTDSVYKKFALAANISCLHLELQFL